MRSTRFFEHRKNSVVSGKLSFPLFLSLPRINTTIMFIRQRTEGFNGYSVRNLDIGKGALGIDEPFLTGEMEPFL